LEPNGSLYGLPDRVNYTQAFCNNPIAFSHNGKTAIVWFDNSSGGDRVKLARQGALGWDEAMDLSRGSGEAAFARPIVDRDGVNVIWQGSIRGTRRIYLAAPDSTVASPQIRPLNFTAGRRNRGSLVRIGWSVPEDSSGIRGFAWSWSRQTGETPPRDLMLFDTVNPSVDLDANEDGSWYFSVIVQDRAGNWSAPTRIAYVKDTTPPPAANIIPPETDERGFLLSNTFSISWNIPPASDIAGYTWNLEYMGASSLIPGTGEALTETASRVLTVSASPPQMLLGSGTSAAYTNEDDGLWCFTVSAIDETGNIGVPARIFFKLNKYIPHTYITYVNSRQDEQGVLSLQILGRGFSNGGQLTRVILDKDGVEPYDQEFLLSRGDFKIPSDREINLRTADIEEGVYRVIVVHPLRGTYITPPLVTVDKTGTVKFGDYSRDWKPSWTLHDRRRYIFDTAYLIVIVILIFCALGVFASVRGISSVIAESAAIRMETIALITGDIMPSEKKKRVTRIKRRGVGLRLKMASFIIALVILVVLMVSTPLYVMMTRTQQETLLRGVWDRSTVLLEGLASSARAYMPTNNLLELSYLPSQSVVIPEAKYVTITGYNTRDIYYNHVLATNDPGINAKIDTPEMELGVSRLTDGLSARTGDIVQELNERAREEVGDISATIRSLTQEAIGLVTRTDAESVQRYQAIAVTTQSLETQLNESLIEIGREIGSEPAFSTISLRENTSDSYIFFKPILYRQGSDDTYYRGLIRLEVTIDSIITQVQAGQWILLRTILIVALAAVAIGIIGALIFSSLIIRPISRLVSHVELIRDTEDKTKLEGVEIAIKSRDEIAVLGSTINDMTHGLVKAAAAASDLSIGKEIQKKFIPLDLDREGNKRSSGFKDTKNVQFFGYYEGAKGVSGDYFDYQDLDGRYFAIIKCDVAGKGIPAALIMIQVATMFLNHFKQWKPTEKGMHIEEVVYQINDFIEALAFKGRFAAFTLCLFDSQTGVARFCNAGDNIIHWYDASEGKMRTVTLRETPATGVLPNFLVESKGGYMVQALTIDHGDILFLYTDGIEEAKRRFRDGDFKEILCTEGETDTPHATHTVGQGDEEMGPDRVEGIINAVMNKQEYTLHKYHNPEGEEKDLKFDFTGCDAKVEEAIMAMVSVEKMFRAYKDPKAGADSRVLVDKKVDEFLKKHFLQYRNYCLDTRENPGNDEYMYYTHVKEDDQYDDLTILGINRK
jgi:serine phosphatase RsbU (regulator of sigma subunit)